ncbi:ras-related protein Rab-44 isoform X1 [Podarcis lilfordi]|uniref:Ras-related protein Rab-44 isoform X1 n=1 Tax=Podarcis lilfordi TaxID=74358 RepID=A0AA35KHQ1_9SAUR|nr:ras-related protein Rab-44 isoform X1 [Podarcis lilfordi]
MDKQRMPGRKFGSSRRKQARGTWGSTRVSSISEEEPCLSELMEKVRNLSQGHGKKEGFITRADMQKLEADFPWSTKELELVFDGLDADSKGYLTTEEFTEGLRYFLSSQTVTRAHRKRKMLSLKAPTHLSLEEADTEEQMCFKAFLNQLGADNIFEDESEIWKIWVQLRQDEPHLLGNLKEFLAKMTHLIKESRGAKQTLQLMLKTRVADHNKEVQQLYEELEQQIDKETRRLQLESKTQSQFLSVEMKELLDAREREIQHFLDVQKELETQFLSLREKQHVASTQTQELKQTNMALEVQLQKTLNQLQKTQRQLDFMRGRVSQLHKEESGRSPEEVSVKTTQSQQGHLSANEMSSSELVGRFGYNPSEDTLDSSAQKAPGGVASMAKAGSESRTTRVISIEEDPWVDSVVEPEKYFPQEVVDQSSLLRELNDAIAAVNKVSESSNNPQIDNFGFQFLGQIKENGNSQQRKMQEKITPYDASSRNRDLQKRSAEALSGRASWQRDALLQERLTCAPEVKNANISEPRREVKTLESKQRGCILVPEVQSSVYKELTSPAGDYKEDSMQEKTLILEQAVQLHGQVLKCSGISRTQWPPADSEQRVVKQSLESKTSEKKIQHPSVEDMPPAHSSPRIALPKLDEGCEPEITVFQNHQLENMLQPEMQTQTTDGLEVTLSEDKREGCMDLPGCRKNQEVRVEMDEETNVKAEAADYPVDVDAKATSKDTTAVFFCPDHMYNVLFVGDSNVGKTSFLHRLQDDSFDANMTATVGMDYRIKSLFVDNKCFALRLWDTAGQERYHSITKQFFRKADGVVLMYDITSEHSFAEVRYWMNCIQEGSEDGVVILLLGNKTDCAAERRVSSEDGAYLAKEYGLSFNECSAALGQNVTESMVKLVRLLKTHEDKFKQEILELPVPSGKKRGCCS